MKRKEKIFNPSTILESLEHAAKKESWGKLIIQLAWTAGPVTYLALQGGYIIGYGKYAPSHLFIYFGFYTIIAGLTSVIVRFVYNATKGKRVDRIRGQLNVVLERLPDFILLIRDINLALYQPEERRTIASKYILENPDASEPAVQMAVEELTGDKNLAEVCKRIEIFRKHGMSACIQEEYKKIEKKLKLFTDSISETAPQLRDTFLLRFLGDVPSKKAGIRRNPGFIERVLTSEEQLNFDLVGISDVEEIITLAFELIAGRSFPLLVLKYSGTQKFTESARQLDTARRNFRSAAYIRNSRLRLFTTALTQAGIVDYVSAAELFEINSYELELFMEKAFQKWLKLMKSKPGETEKNLIRKTAFLFKELLKANQRVFSKYRDLQEAKSKYYAIKRNEAGTFPLIIKNTPGPDKGIRILKRNIYLEEENKFKFIENFFHVLDETWKKSPRPGTIQFSREHSSFTTQILKLKQLAVEIVTLLEPEIHLSNFPVQQAIETSNAPNLSTIETNLTGHTKIEWAVSLVQEVETDLRQQAVSIAKVLVNYHGISLNEDIIRYLADRFAVQPEKLRALSPAPDETDQERQDSVLFEIPPMPPALQKMVKRL